MGGIQPNNQTVFERTRYEFHLDPKVLVSKNWFRLCKTTVNKIYKLLLDNDEWKIQAEDLTDYTNSLRAVRSKLEEFKNSKFGPLCPFGRIISMLDEAKRPLGGALGMRNVYAPRRTKYIQEFRTKLQETVSLMDAVELLKGFNDIPP